MFGLFSKDKGLGKTIERATNKLSQQADRWAALEKLKEDGSEAALIGLCKRWSITSTKATEDEQEKNWVVDVLVSIGGDALTPLRRHMKSTDSLSFPLRALERIGTREQVLEAVDELFASEPPGYTRFPDRRIDLIRWFADWKGATDEEVVSRLTPYVTDFDENVRFSTIEGIARRDPKLIAPPLIAGLLRPEEESGRIKRTIVEVLAKAKAPLGDEAPKVSAALTGPLSEYRVDAGIVQHR